jgi:hypothetical protein
MIEEGSASETDEPEHPELLDKRNPKPYADFRGVFSNKTFPDTHHSYDYEIELTKPDKAEWY